MKPAAIAALCLATSLTLAGCKFDSNGSDAVTRQVGRDYVGAGGMLNLTDAVVGDGFLAGGHVDVASQVGGDLVVVGGEVSVGGSIGDDLYAAGGNVKLDAIVTGNARIAGGDIAVGPATVVAGALSMTGGRVAFDGDAHDGLQASGAKVRLNGVVHGDAEIHAEEVELGPDARIAGRLVVYSSSKPTVAPGASVAGGTEFHETSPGRYFDDGRSTARNVAHGVGSVLWFAGVFIASALFLFVFPEFSARAAAALGREPLKAFALGLAVLVCVPAIAIVLLITVIGIPLALLLVPLYLLLLFLGWITTAFYLAHRGLAWLRPSAPATTGWRLLALLAALVLLSLLTSVPHVGDWLNWIAVLVGMGALVWQAWSDRARVIGAAV
jgi:hypothetical protein